MSTEKKETKAATEHADFLSTNNRIVVPEFPKCVFMKSHFRYRTQKTNEDPPDIESYPVALLSVLGSHKNQMSMIYTDWLITFLENQRVSSVKKLEIRDKPRFIDFRSNPATGVYIWPTKYVIRRKNSSNMVLLVLYTNAGNVETIENFVAVACSHVFVLEGMDKECLQNRTTEVFLQVKKRQGIVSSCTSNLLPISENDRNKTAFAIFLEQLANTEFLPIRRSSGTDLELKDLRIFLQSVEDKVNSAIQLTKHPRCPDEKRLSIVNQTILEVGSTLGPIEDQEDGSVAVHIEDSEVGTTSTSEEEPQHVDSGVDQLTSEIANMNLGEPNNVFLKENPSPTSGNPVSETIIDDYSSTDTTGTKSCDELQCGPLLTKLEYLISNWILVNLIPSNISSLLSCCENNIIDDKHNIFEELGDVVDIIDLHNIQLCNLFDNYVCFSGDINFNQLKLLITAVNSRSMSRLVAKSHKHSNLTNNILQMAERQLHLYYVKDNESIIILEEETAKKVNEILVRTYKKLMITLLKQQPTHKAIQDSHVLLKEGIILKAQLCMNIGDRFNEIAKSYSLQVSNQLDVVFRELRKHCIRNECSSAVNDMYIEEFLAIFYADERHGVEKDVDEIVTRHENVVKNVTSELKGVRKSNLQLRLDMHLFYITEVLSQESTLKNIAADVAIHSFCLHLTSKFYDLYFKANNHNTNNDYPGNTKPAYVALTKEDKFVFDFEAHFHTTKKSTNTKARGSILDLICDPSIGGKYNKTLIENFFKKIIWDVERYTFRKNNNLIIAIPQNLDVEQRLRLRSLAKSAGIKHIFLVSEVSFLAFSQLCLKSRAENANVEIIVAVQIYYDGIQVGIFEQKSENKIQLSAVAFQPWQYGKSNASTSCRFWRKTNPFSSEHPRSNCKITLGEAISCAFSQVDHTAETKSIQYSITSKRPKHHNIFDEVFRERPNWLEIHSSHPNPFHKAAQHFSDNPVCLASVILDHGINLKDFNRLEETFLQNHLKFGQTSHDLNVPHEPNLLENKKRLFSKCHLMRSQLSNGSVEVRRLTKKLITECIDRAEKIANDTYTTQEMILSEQQELDELINEHNFLKY